MEDDSTRVDGIEVSEYPAISVIIRVCDMAEKIGDVLFAGI